MLPGSGDDAPQSSHHLHLRFFDSFADASVTRMVLDRDSDLRPWILEEPGGALAWSRLEDS